MSPSASTSLRENGDGNGNGDSAEEDETLQVLVCASNGRDAGLVVRDILDICEDKLEVKGPATRTGVLYTAVVQDKVTEFVDVDALLAAGLTTIADASAPAAEEGSDG